MKHLWRTIGVASLATGVGLGAGGCTDEETGLFISGVLAAAPPQCSVRADPSAAQLLQGRLDVFYKHSYDATLLVGNQFTQRGDKENLRSETSIVTITGAEVRLLDDVGALTEEFTVPATGVISPDSGEEPGFGGVLVPLIPDSTGFDLEMQLVLGQAVTRVARAKVFGATIGGVEVESSEFTFVIKVCKGCSYTIPPQGCEDVDSAPEPPCDPGQDTPMDCRLYPQPF